MVVNRGGTMAAPKVSAGAGRLALLVEGGGVLDTGWIEAFDPGRATITVRDGLVRLRDGAQGDTRDKAEWFTTEENVRRFVEAGSILGNPPIRTDDFGDQRFYLIGKPPIEP
ncbi:MAG: hypothetical protein R3F11_20175 [Verrucomicrobiales bacterium]